MGAAPRIVAAALTLTACNAVLGIRELRDDSVAGLPDGSVPGAEGGTDGGGGPPVIEPPPGPATWRLAATSTSLARHSATIAFDEQRQRMVLFGGVASVSSMLGDTWEWDGASWSERTVPENPAKRYGHRMVHDGARKNIFLFGGSRGDSPDQWIWDGTRWRAKPSATSPPSFQTLAMTYDSDRSVVVIFGGNHYPASGSAFMRNEIWEWNGSDWSHRDISPAPLARRGHALAYDAARKRVVLFGGKAVNQTLGDTWEYDGTRWTEHEPIDYPSRRAGSCMAYDPRRRLIVMYGGAENSSSNFAQTWQWDGVNWSRGPDGPPALRSCAMAWDPARRALVLFGGALDGDSSSSGETWVYE